VALLPDSPLVENLSHQEKYKEACTVIRHYSNCVIGVRTVAIVQGLVVVGCAGFLSKEARSGFAIATSGFGLLLTFVLFTFHRSYLAYFNRVLAYVVQDLERGDGPWSRYDLEREHLRSWRWYRVAHLYGAVSVIAIALAGVALYNVLYLLW